MCPADTTDPILNMVTCVSVVPTAASPVPSLVAPREVLATLANAGAAPRAQTAAAVPWRRPTALDLARSASPTPDATPGAPWIGRTPPPAAVAHAASETGHNEQAIPRATTPTPRETTAARETTTPRAMRSEPTARTSAANSATTRAPRERRHDSAPRRHRAVASEAATAPSQQIHSAAPAPTRDPSVVQRGRPGTTGSDEAGHRQPDTARQHPARRTRPTQPTSSRTTGGVTRAGAPQSASGTSSRSEASASTTSGIGRHHHLR